MKMHENKMERNEGAAPFVFFLYVFILNLDFFDEDVCAFQGLSTLSLKMKSILV